jgi:hypothetical protein
LLHAIVSSTISKDISPDYLNYLDWTEKALGNDNDGRSVINFRKEFTELFNKTKMKVQPPNDAHWNSLGHQLVAKKFVDYIQKNFNTAPYKKIE